MGSAARWTLWALGTVWSLPHTLVGLLLLVTVYRPEQLQWSTGAIDVRVRGNLIPSWAWAQTHGILIFYRDERAELDAGLRKHERAHIIQCMIFGGIIYPVLYGLFSLCLLVAGFDYYRDNPFERWARASENRRLPWIMR